MCARDIAEQYNLNKIHRTLGINQHIYRKRKFTTETAVKLTAAGLLVTISKTDQSKIQILQQFVQQSLLVNNIVNFHKSNSVMIHSSIV